MQRSLPYQWALLKSFAETDPDLLQNVQWLEPFHLLLTEANEFINELDRGEWEQVFCQIGVFGISCYVWNREVQLKIARIVRSLNPKCLIVAGGPDLPYTDTEFLRQNSFIDIIVKKDGEIPFRKILSELVGGTNNFQSVPGLILLSRDGIVDTGVSESIKLFQVSPWLRNREYLETIIERYKKRQESLTVVFETNRGCPYSCTYCNWGSNTMSKIRTFDLENIKEEIKWFSNWGVGEFWIADANFGILARDIEISDWLSELSRAKSGAFVQMFAAKNHPEQVAKAALTLHRAGLLRDFYIGIQSTSPVTLAAIGRTNMKLEKHIELVRTLKENGVPVVGQLILGCPGETVESWRKTVIDVFEMGISAQVFSFQILCNTPADAPAYRQKWNLETIKMRKVDGYIAEFIRASATFNHDEYIEMELYAMMVRDLRRLPPIVKTAKFICGLKDMPIKEFFDFLFDKFFCVEVYPVASVGMQNLRTLLRKRDEVDENGVTDLIVYGDENELFQGPQNYLGSYCVQNALQIRSELNQFVEKEFGVVL